MKYTVHIVINDGYPTRRDVRSFGANSIKDCMDYAKELIRRKHAKVPLNSSHIQILKDGVLVEYIAMIGCREFFNNLHIR